MRPLCQNSVHILNSINSRDRLNSRWWSESDASGRWVLISPREACFHLRANISSETNFLGRAGQGRGPLARRQGKGRAREGQRLGKAVRFTEYKVMARAARLQDHIRLRSPPKRRHCDIFKPGSLIHRAGSGLRCPFCKVCWGKSDAGNYRSLSVSNNPASFSLL
jgi:hypothetical protein